MRAPRRPLFLGRAGYRARRLRDAARLLPVLGLILVMLPLLWAPAAGMIRATVGDAIYLFVVWVALIGAAAALAPGLTQNSGDGGSDDGASDDGGDDAL
jgi:hypothetical protein